MPGFCLSIVPQHNYEPLMSFQWPKPGIQSDAGLGFAGRLPPLSIFHPRASGKSTVCGSEVAGRFAPPFTTPDTVHPFCVFRLIHGSRRIPPEVSQTRNVALTDPGAALHDRPVKWACQASHWSTTQLNPIQR